MEKPNKKIDIYVSGRYACSSIRYRNLLEAKEGFLRNPSWQGLRRNGTLGTVVYTPGFCDSIAVWWSDR